MAGSWNRVNHFIIEADQMTHPIHWNPMEDKWKAWVNNGLSDHEVLDMAYDWSGKGLDFLYKRGWIAVRNPSMGNTFLDMDEARTATKAQVNAVFDYISKFNRYDMDVSKVMAD